MRLSSGDRPNIQIGGHSLNSMLGGVEYFVTDVTGWLDRPDIKQDSVSRELTDGDFPAPWHFGPRLIGIDGVAFCRDWAEQHHIVDQLNGLAANRREWLTIQGPGPMQSALVEVSGNSNFRMGINGVLRFELRFKANDPRKYGELRTADVSTSWTTIRHYGNYPATPSFVLTSSDIGDSGFLVYGEYPDEERRIWWYDYATSGATHRINFATGEHLVGGTPRPERVRRSETWAIDPHVGMRTLVRPQTSGDGDISGTVSWRDTWI